ncbi:MAG: phosphate transporter periplasmic phosphate-binding protein, partial [Verrucomicrobia bacterium]|nr:phosphate transporter periplasmic phosphate-binding protein [Verrucomicrobiota bacterium]
EKNIRTWGQLGLTGEWADKPIHVLGYNLQFHFPQEITSRAFGGVTSKWNEQLREYANKLLPNGKFKLAGESMLEDVAKDPYAIAYVAGGGAWQTPATKALALSVKTGGPEYELTLDNVQSRQYPMYADVFFFLDREPGKPVDPKIREFMRFILSREGQELVMKDGKYLPLTGDVVREQLKKLE